MTASMSLRFAAAARALGRQARAMGLTVPGFRSPPRVPGTNRSIRRNDQGAVTVSVRLTDRTWADVAADMIEGVIAANNLNDGDAAAARVAFNEALTVAQV